MQNLLKLSTVLALKAALSGPESIYFTVSLFYRRARRDSSRGFKAFCIADRGGLSTILAGYPQVFWVFKGAVGGARQKKGHFIK